MLCMFSAGLVFRVTLQDGSKWLVHKGDDYGKSSQTIVVDGRHMSNNWKASALFIDENTLKSF